MRRWIWFVLALLAATQAHAINQWRPDDSSALPPAGQRDFSADLGSSDNLDLSSVEVGRHPYKPFGPGSLGYLPTCSGTFNVGQAVKYSNSFTNSTQWPLGNIGAGTGITVAAAPEITDPYGGHNAYAVSFNAIPISTSNVSQLYTSSSNISWHGGYPNTFTIWVLGTPGYYFGSNEQITATSPEGTATVQLTGKWQRITFQATPSGGAHYFTIGNDLRDPAQYAILSAAFSGSVPAQTVYIYNAQVIEGKVALPDTITTNVNANSASPAYNAFVAVTANCPPGVAFRDFSHLAFAGFNIQQGNYAGSPTWAGGPSAGNLGYQGVGAAAISPTAFTVNGTWYGLANCINGNHNTYLWGQCLYSSTGPTAQWTWLQAAVSPGVSTPLTTYILHSSPLDKGCTYSATFYQYCWLLSGSTTGPLSGNTVNLTATTSLTSPSFVTPSTSMINATVFAALSAQYSSAVNDPNVPGCITVALQYFCMTSINDTNLSAVYNATIMNYLPTSAGSHCGSAACSANTDQSSTAWIAYDYALRIAISTDWDYGYHPLDNNIIYNKHGFYEYFYTAFGAKQYIGYAVAADIHGPWYKQNACPIGGPNPGCVFPYPSAPYAGSNFIGDTYVVEQNGSLIITGNYDSGSTASGAYVAIMPDY